MKFNIGTNIHNLRLDIPVMNASGTLTLNEKTAWITKYIGAYVTKSVTLNPRKGNQQLRIAEVKGGILNSIGLQNHGINHFMDYELPELSKYKIPIIISLVADSIHSFREIFRIISNHRNNKLFEGIEINVSCPNVQNGLSIGTSASNVKFLANIVVDMCKDKTTIMKLTPNVTDISTVATSAAYSGIDAVTVINTVRGCAIDIKTKTFVLGNKIGGLSGPVIKPIGLAAVHECYKTVGDSSTQIIGVGGIMNYTDVLEYMMAGAGAVQIGSGFFSNPRIYVEIAEGLKKYIEDNNVRFIKNIVGIVR